MKYVASPSPGLSFLGADKIRVEPNGLPAIAQRQNHTHGTTLGVSKAWGRALDRGLAMQPRGDIEFILGAVHAGSEDIEIRFYG